MANDERFTNGSDLQLVQHDTKANAPQRDVGPDAPEFDNSAEPLEVLQDLGDTSCQLTDDPILHIRSSDDLPIPVDSHIQETVDVSVIGSAETDKWGSTRRRKFVAWIVIIIVIAIAIGVGVGIGVKVGHSR